MALCMHCGAVFAPKFDGAKLCFACFLQTPRGQQWARNTGYGQEPPHQRSWRGTHQYQAPPEQPTKERIVYKNLPDFDKVMVRRMLQLCHPDKHGGSELAVKVTQWLNERAKEL